MSSDFADAMMLALKDTLDMMSKSTEWLMESLVAIREKRYPTPSHVVAIKAELKRRVPEGCLVVWNERRGLCPR